MNKEKALFYLICFVIISIALKWLLAFASFMGILPIFSYWEHMSTIRLISIVLAATCTAHTYRKS